MQFKSPKNTKEFYWTNHVVFKMRCYGLSAQKVLGVVKRPARKEEGIVKNTIAVMQPVNPKILNGKKIWKQEVWVMYQAPSTRGKHKTPASTRGDSSTRGGQITKHKQISAQGGPAVGWQNSKQIENYKPQTTNYKLKIISAWRYPGVSPKKNPIPEDILAEIGDII
jgi:hypothetical protein